MFLYVKPVTNKNNAMNQMYLKIKQMLSFGFPK